MHQAIIDIPLGAVMVLEHVITGSLGGADRTNHVRDCTSPPKCSKAGIGGRVPRRAMPAQARADGLKERQTDNNDCERGSCERDACLG